MSRKAIICQIDAIAEHAVLPDLYSPAALLRIAAALSDAQETIQAEIDRHRVPVGPKPLHQLLCGGQSEGGAA